MSWSFERKIKMAKNRNRDLVILFLTIIIAITIPISIVSSSSSSSPDHHRIILSRVDRRIDLTSQLVRITSTLKLENAADDDSSVSELLFAIPDKQALNLSFLTASSSSSSSKGSTSSSSGSGGRLEAPSIVHRQGTPPAVTLYALSLPELLRKGQAVTIHVLAVYTHSLTPFPQKITQADPHLVLFQDSAFFFSPYTVNTQTLTIKLPDTRIESYTKLQNTKVQGSEIKYGPYRAQPPYSYSPIVAHFENNHPFAVAQELLREIEVSHWGNVQITEHYNLVHGGAQSKGEFSRLDYQARPHIRGASAFKNLVAKLPPRAHSVYYRDEIGNISTSNLRGDLKKTELLIEPRYPMFGGWKTSFTIGYGLPLEDYLFQSDGKRFLNITFGCPISEVVIDKLTVKVVLPEGSKDISVSVPFSVNELQETKFSHLDVVGRPVVVLEKGNVVQEHNQHFQVPFKKENGQTVMVPLFHNQENITGKITIEPVQGKKIEHNGVKVELLGQIEMYFDRGNFYDFTSLVRELDVPGEIYESKTYPFEFSSVEMPYETYNGVNVRLRYILKVTITRGYAGTITEHKDFVVRNYTPAPSINNSIKMEVGIEDCLHIEFEYNKSKYHLKDVIIGKIYFLLVRIKIKNMDLEIRRRESTGSGANTHVETETLAKFELMDGAPVRGESIPVRLFLSPYELTSTHRNINNKFNVKYFLNLVLVDEEDRRYFKQQEITLLRIPEESS